MNLELRDFQAGGIEQLRHGFAAGTRSQMFYAPTGAGKTETAIAMLQAAAEKGVRSAIVMDRVVLCDQTSKRLDKYGIPHGVLQAGHWRYRPHELIQVCSAQTLEKRGSFPGLGLLIVDEAHNTRKQTALFIKNNPGVKVVGLSASPFTKGLNEIYGGVVNCATTDDLIERKFLVPLRVFQAKQIDMTGAKKVAGEWSADEASSRGMKITGDVVREWVSKTHEIFGGPKKTIVFCAGVAHGEDLARQFGEAGYNFVSISYKDDDDFKADAIAEFGKAESSIDGLIATDILTKGFDVADVMIGVSARPFTKSLSSHIQQLGRVMRPHPVKEFAVWLDHAGNYLRFQEDCEDIFGGGCSKLDGGGEKGKPEPKERDKAAATCPKCKAIFPVKQDVCSHCGFQRLRHNGVVVLPGELEEVKRRERTRNVEAEKFYAELTGIAEMRSYKPGWAWHKFQEKFGYTPHGIRVAAASPSFATLKWVQSRNIKWAKSGQRAA